MPNFIDFGSINNFILMEQMINTFDRNFMPAIILIVKYYCSNIFSYNLNFNLFIFVTTCETIIFI